MLRRDRDAVLCDLAQYYHIYSINALPAADTARLVAGLPPDSRIMQIVTGRSITIDQMLLAAIADRLGLLVWLQTKDGRRGRRKPKQILELLNEQKAPGENEPQVKAYDSIEAFEAAREQILKSSQELIDGNEGGEDGA